MVTPLATLNPQHYTQIAAGVYYKHSRTPLDDGNIIDVLQPFGAGNVDEVGLMSYVKFDSYNNNIATPTGIQLNIAGQLGLVTPDSVYGVISADVLGFTSTDRLPGHPMLAVRMGAQKNIGAYPFYSAAFLGGSDNLKGYAPNRFGGDLSVYLNTEMRVFVTEIRWPIPANFGVLGIADVGRVFVTGESSNVWHTGFGGGIWFGLLRSGQGLNLALVEGESLRLYISTGFILKKKRIF
jgi:outer membrane protein assembly factor BamA